MEINSFYMNPWTGSVALGSEWLNDFDSRDDKSQSWEEWGGVYLIEVQKDEQGHWSEL